MKINLEKIDKCFNKLDVIATVLPFSQHDMLDALVTLNPLEASILKWKCIVELLKAGHKEEAIESDDGIKNCGLCYKYYKHDIEEDLYLDNDEFFYSQQCDGCPVKIRTGKPLCENSLYQSWSYADPDDEDQLLFAAKEELAFLISLGENDENTP